MRGIRTRNAKERPEVLDAEMSIRDLDPKPEESHSVARKDKRRPHFDAVREKGKENDEARYGKLLETYVENAGQ